MTTAVFGIPADKNHWSISFAAPSKTLMATNLDEVIPLLKTVEKEAFNGNYVALMLSYEAAPVFDPAMQTHDSGSLPFAWAAVFPQPDSSFERPRSTYTLNSWKPEITREAYDDAIATIHEYIRKGDTYQVNYTFPVRSQFQGDSFSCYEDLCIAQGSNFSAYLDLGRFKILSLSPELFFERKGDVVTTRPMKGTIRRGRWWEEDQELAGWLRNSAKDRAENVMIVDLLRNDLGRVSVHGSVNVTSLFELERFETVWQMTSTVESTLRPETTLVELMSSLFPCGSITGAPKIRTMQIIRELEDQPRGIYTGAIGLIKPGGDCVFNVAIRTVVIDSQTGAARFGVGGGITIDSTAEREYEECLTKAKFLQARPRSFDLFESILLEDGQYFLLDQHLKRLQTSAEFLNFRFDVEEIRSRLEDIRQANQLNSFKVKLTLNRSGDISTNLTEIVPATVWRVALASVAVDSSDRLLFHKTTARELYDTQLKQRPDCDDLLFFNERGQITESTVANVVLKLDGKFVTPAKASGLLAGTYRDQMISDGLVEERVVTREDLLAASEVFLINSVRKKIAIVLV